MSRVSASTGRSGAACGASNVGYHLQGTQQSRWTNGAKPAREAPLRTIRFVACRLSGATTLRSSFLAAHSAKAASRPWIFLSPLLAMVLILLISMPIRAEWIGDQRALMGTEVRVYLWHDNAELGQQLVDAVFDETVRIDEMMSTYKESSRISDINRRAADEAVFADMELFRVIQKALDISVLTHGAFDITYDSVGQHYNFRERQRPDDATIALERQRINFRLVELDGMNSTVRYLRPGVRINLGGIAKGYVVERGAEILRHAGVKNAVVTAGGDSRLLGDRRGRPFMIGIRDPRGDGEVAITLPLEDEAISTSGDYERFFDEDGIRYHHIIKPSTGTPAGGVHSATVFGPDAVMTDALSTSVFVMGVDLGLKLISGLPDYESIVIDAEGRIFYSDGLQQPSADELEP